VHNNKENFVNKRKKKIMKNPPKNKDLHIDLIKAILKHEGVTVKEVLYELISVSEVVSNYDLYDFEKEV
jgi:hypothetical protein